MEERKMKKVKFKVIFLVLLFAFTHFLNTNVNAFLFQLPKRYAAIPPTETFETNFWNYLWF